MWSFNKKYKYVTGESLKPVVNSDISIDALERLVSDQRERIKFLQEQMNRESLAPDLLKEYKANELKITEICDAYYKLFNERVKNHG